MVGGLALFVSMETYHGSSFRSDRDLLVAALQHARAQAMNNICLGTGCTDGKPHGVYIQSDKYIVFQGGTYNSSDSNNAEFDSTITTTKTPSTLEIVFSQLSGTTSCSNECAVTLTDQSGHVSIATTTAEGRIYWSN